MRYARADGRDVAIGPVEPKFRAILFQKIGAPSLTGKMIAFPDRRNGAAAILEDNFRQRPVSEWAALRWRGA